MRKLTFLTIALILSLSSLTAFAQKKTFTETVNGVSFKMIYVEGGTFTMGATPEQKKYLQKILRPGEFMYNMFGEDIFDDEYPAHNVNLDSYFIGETEVTQELWDAVMDVKSNQLFEENFEWEYDEDSERERYFMIFKIGKKYPMHNVSWYDAQEFCKKLSQLTGKRYCLPTEAQWEYAARGGKYSKKYIFSGGNNIVSPAGLRLKYAKSSTPNELGVYNMSGNVREWCYDWYDEYSAIKQNNPIGPTDGREKVIRGRAHTTSMPALDIEAFCRITSRHYGSPHGKSCNGFRIALIPEDVNTERDGYEWVSLKGESNLCGAQVGGKVVVPAEYSEVKYMPYYNGYFLVGKGGYMGVYDCMGNYLIPIDRCYSSILKTCSDGRYYYRVCKNGKYGACNLKGTEIVEPIYRDLILYNGVFIYRNDADWLPLSIGIDNNNEVIENPQLAQTSQINYDIALEQAKLEEAFGKDVKVEQVVTEDGRRAFKIVFENQILFEFGKSTLNAQAIKYIEQVAEALKKLPSTNVIIKGYTDNVGTLEANQRVSNRRAKVVSDRLTLLGISASRLTSQGVPLADYVASNDTEEGRALNRRVEIVIEPME